MNAAIEAKIISYPTSHDLLRDFAKWMSEQNTNEKRTYEWRWQGSLMDKETLTEKEVDETQAIRLGELIAMSDLTDDDVDVVVGLPVGGVWVEPLGEFPTSRSTITRLT